MKSGSWRLLSIGIALGLFAGSVFTMIMTWGILTTPATYYITNYITTTSYITRTVTVISILNTTLQSSSSSCVIFRALKDDFNRSEPVIFRLTNNCEEDLILPNSAPWIIKNSKGETIFSPTSLQVILKIKPGSFKEWSWNQRDNSGKSVEPGTYYIIIQTSNRGSFTLTIRIY